LAIKSNKDIPFILLGDSHSRSFSYNSYIVPIFIGPAAFNNFLTDKNANSVGKKCLSIIDKIPHDIIILTCFSGDPEHHARPVKHQRSRNDIIFPDIQLLHSAAERYVKLLLEINLQKNREIVAISPIPGTYEEHCVAHTIYTQYFLSLCEKKNIKTICINNKISNKTKLLKKYSADFIHISPNSIHYYLDSLSKLFPNLKITKSYPKGWQNKHELVIQKSILKIWGDCNQSDLICKYGDILKFENLDLEQSLKTQAAKVICKFIYLLESTEMENKSVNMLDSHDGFYCFLLSNLLNFSYNIYGTDHSSLNVARSNFLNYFHRDNNCKFIQIRKNDFIKTNFYVSLDRINSSESYLKSLISFTKTNNKIVFFLTNNFSSTKDLFHNNGFKRIFYIPIPKSFIINKSNYSLLFAVPRSLPFFETLKIRYFCFILLLQEFLSVFNFYSRNFIHVFCK